MDIQGAVVMDQSVKCFTHNHKDPSSDPQPHRKLGEMVCACNSNSRVGPETDPWNLVTSQHAELVNSKFNERLFLKNNNKQKKKVGKTIKEDLKLTSGIHMHTHMYIHAHIPHTHVCVHTHTHTLK